jgi:hypothetical protein
MELPLLAQLALAAISGLIVVWSCRDNSRGWRRWATGVAGGISLAILVLIMLGLVLDLFFYLLLEPGFGLTG